MNSPSSLKQGICTELTKGNTAKKIISVSNVLKVYNSFVIDLLFVFMEFSRSHPSDLDFWTNDSVQQYFPSISQLPQYISLPEEYTIYFPTTKSFIFANHPYWHYSLCFPCTFLFFEQQYKLDTSIERFQTRHVEKYDILIKENLPAGMDEQHRLTLFNTLHFPLLLTTIYQLI